MTDRLYQKLVADVTELKANNGDKACLEVIKDLCSRRILTWSISAHPDLKFSLALLKALMKQLPQTGYQITLHTDQGWQYQHRSWRQLLKRMYLRQSMSRKATFLENAVCETVFDKLKVEIGSLKQYENTLELTEAINTWIDYYNQTRIQIKLGGQSPLDFERQLTA